MVWRIRLPVCVFGPLERTDIHFSKAGRSRDLISVQGNGRLQPAMAASIGQPSVQEHLRARLPDLRGSRENWLEPVRYRS